MKQYYCFLERFNNYFNRKIIKFDTLAEYKNASKDFFIPEDSNSSMIPFDFNPNDNITTEIIVNDVPFDPDYFLLLDAEANIVQRWFVIEQKRNRQGQWLYQLKRDVISDNLDSILDSPIFVQKGMLPESDKFILNNEGMSFNQIKRQENLVKDETKTAWIVGYIAKNTDGVDIPITIASEQISGDIKQLSDIASQLGITEGTLGSLINLNGAQTSPAYVSNSISIGIDVQTPNEIGPLKYRRYNFNLSSDLNSKIDWGEESSRYDIYGPYLFHSSNFISTDISQNFPDKVIANGSLLLAQIQSILSRSYYFYDETALLNLRGQKVFYLTKYYQIDVVKASGHTTTINNINYSTYSSLKKIADDTVNAKKPYADLSIISDDPKYRAFSSIETTYYIIFNEISASDLIPEYNVTLSASRIPTSDQEFDMFVIPYETGVNIKSNNDNLNFYTVEGLGIKSASAIASSLGKKLYDIQLLPYFPFGNGMYLEGYEYLDLDKLLSNTGQGQIAYSTIGLTQESSGTKSVTFEGPVGYHGPAVYPIGYSTWYLYIQGESFGLPTGTRFTNMTYTYTDPNGTVDAISYTDFQDDDNNIIAYRFQYNLHTNNTPPDADFSITINVDYISPQGAVGSIIIYCQSSTFQKYTEFGIPNEINNSDISLKVLSNAYYMRLCSPNYQGSFDVNIGKNNGKIKGYYLYGTYKPYTPYIKVAPVFESLYGSNFGDQRGLICAGDFSLPRIIDEWQNYQLNNKNYQNIFNREIQNMEFLQSIDMRNQIVSGAVGILGDTAKGAGAGAMVGGPYGAIAGGIIGGTASGIGFGIDVDTLARTQREQKQLAIDKFNYQLGNIKALPYTLTNIGAFNINSKIYPFLEIYTPTDEELTAFNNKIKWESMTVMRIDTMRNYWRQFNELCYFKGELIRCDEIADDAHVLNNIYEELLKGVYI